MTKQKSNRRRLGGGYGRLLSFKRSYVRLLF
nr:MAG TPA: hypothetical protein [Caudoviricetes sp.]